MARSIFKATIAIGNDKIPVKLYSAVEDRSVHFRLLHRPDRVPVKQRMVNAQSGEPVERGDIRKGYPIGKDTFVLLTEEEIDALEPESSREITLSKFVNPETIHPQWYERPYFLGPDGDNALYAALATALTERNKEGIATWVMRKKRYFGALSVREGHLGLIVLRYAQEVVSVPAIHVPANLKPAEKETKLAEQLIDSLIAPFDPGEFHDTYRERLLAMLEAKAQGRRIKPKKVERRRPTTALSDMLRQSIATAKERKVA